MDDLRSADVDFLTIGQYLQPTRKHAAGQRALFRPMNSKATRRIARTKGFLLVVVVAAHALELSCRRRLRAPPRRPRLQRVGWVERLAEHAPRRRADPTSSRSFGEKFFARARCTHAFRRWAPNTFAMGWQVALNRHAVQRRHPVRLSCRRYRGIPSAVFAAASAACRRTSVHAHHPPPVAATMLPPPNRLKFARRHRTDFAYTFCRPLPPSFTKFRTPSHTSVCHAGIAARAPFRTAS